MRFGILRKVFLTFFIISIVPASILSINVLKQMNNSGSSLLEVSRNTIVSNSLPMLEVRAKSIAKEIEQLLNKSVNDLNLLAKLPQNRTIHKKFYRNNKGRIWIREGKENDYVEISKKIPLYSEVIFANKDGIIVIYNGNKRRKNRDISKAFRSNYGQENYFQNALSLKGKIYVGRVTGIHVNKDKQLNGAKDVEKAVGGSEFNGIVRFSKAIYRKGDLLGVVSIALDHRHLMELTQHVVPLNKNDVVFPKYNSGNYAFSVDDEGWIITHPRYWYIRGVDSKTGELFTSYSGTFNEEKLKKGLIPYNLTDSLTDYTSMVKSVLKGNSGVSKIEKDGKLRLIVYAPIKFSTGIYKKRNCFGGVVLEVNSEIYKDAMGTLVEVLKTTSGAIKQISIVILTITLIAIALLSFLTSRRVNRTIIDIIRKTNDIINGEYKTSLDIRSKDEFEMLGKSFMKMGKKIFDNERKFSSSIKKLEKDRDIIKSNAKYLETHIKILQNIHSNRDIFNESISLEKDYLFESILKNCVDTIGFERAELYIYDKKQDVLVCSNRYGSYMQDEFIDIKLPLSEETIQTSVFKSSESVFIKDINKSKLEETLLVRSGREKSYSFAVLPLLVSGIKTGVLVVDHISLNSNISSKKTELIKILAVESAFVIEKALLMEKQYKRSYRQGSLKVLADIVAIELRDPLKEITLVLNDLYNSHAQSDLIEKALSEIDEMADVVRDLDSFSRLGATYPVEVEVNGLLKDLLILIKESFQGEIMVNLNPSQEKTMVLVEEDTIVSEISNIILQWVQKEESPELNIDITVRAKENESRYAVLSITDNASNVRGGKYIYNPFFKMDSGGFFKTGNGDEAKIVLTIPVVKL